MSTLLNIVDNRIFDLNTEKLFRDAEYLFSSNNDIATAIKLLDKILSIDFEHEKALILKGDILLMCGNKTDSLKIYQRVLKINPYSSKANSSVAAILDMLGNTHEAYKYCVKALEYAVNDDYEFLVSLYDQKISLLMELGNFKEIRKTFKQAVLVLNKEDNDYLTSCYKSVTSSSVRRIAAL